MAIFLVSRHPGARQWLLQQHIPIDKMTEHLSIEQLQPGDTVIGNLPVQMVAQLTARQVRYLHLTVNVPRHLRGQELTVENLHQLKAQLCQFTASAVVCSAAENAPE